MPIMMAPVPVSPVILSGTSLSGAINLKTGRMFGIVMPAGWDAAVMTFQVSYDAGTTYNNLYDSTGTEVSYTVAAARFVLMTNSFDWLGTQYLKIRSGTSGTPVNQTADRTIGLAVIQ